jgi:hypothetical protein
VTTGSFWRATRRRWFSVSAFDRSASGRPSSWPRKIGAFRAESLGGCRLVLPQPDHRVEFVYRAFASGTTLILQWGAGDDLNGNAIRVLARIEVLETWRKVHFLLISEPNPQLIASCSTTAESQLTRLTSTDRGFDRFQRSFCPGPVNLEKALTRRGRQPGPTMGYYLGPPLSPSALRSLGFVALSHWLGVG